MPSTVPPIDSAPTASCVYARRPETTLRLHLFSPPGCGGRDRRPAILWFFSGGWSEGGPERVFPDAAATARMGAVGVAAEYRLIHVHGTTPFEAVADARAAMRFLADAGRSLGVDPDRIVAAGASAGAHLACCTAFGTGEAGERARPAALALSSPVLDTTPATWQRETAKPAIRRLIELFGAAGETVSPIHRLHPGWPPTLMIHGGRDRTVPPAHSERFAKALARRGVEHERVVDPDGGHEFARFGVRGNAPFDWRLDVIRRFLVARGILPAENEEPSDDR